MREQNGRLIGSAFSDAVLAIAITLPVVDLKVPSITPGRDLAGAYGGLAHEYVAYGFSFAVIDLYWGYSHFSGKITKKTDHGFNLLTLLFLATVSLTPFPTRPSWSTSMMRRTAVSQRLFTALC